MQPPHTHHQEEIAQINQNILEALRQLEHRKRMEPKAVKMLRRRLSQLYEDLQDAKFKAEQDRVFNKRAFVVRG